MAFTKFDPPGFLTDLTQGNQAAWSTHISNLIDSAAVGDATSNDGPRGQFFNPLVTPPAADAIEKDISWPAFPRIVQLGSTSDKQRWIKADSTRDVQDEYCEWSVSRDNAGKIRRITFTSEGPEYWVALAALQPDTVLALYQTHVDPGVKKSDLFVNGKYNRRNTWNNSTSHGAMHLIQQNNTLGAEIELAAAATIVRRKNGVILTQAQELIRCSQYGAEQRHSDPHIGEEVNALARQKHDITLANPVGLYIAGLNVISWTTPDNSNPLDYWTITRGTPNKALRAVLEVPPTKGFLVGDMTINGKAIEYGGQVADCITIKLTGVATRLGQSAVPPVDGCRGDAAAGVVAAVSAPMSIAQILESARSQDLSTRR